jgi:hypothetical protein
MVVGAPKCALPSPAQTQHVGRLLVDHREVVRNQEDRQLTIGLQPLKSVR